MNPIGAHCVFKIQVSPMMRVVDEYFEARQKIFDHVGYVEDWWILPIESIVENYWRLYGEGPGKVRFADAEEYLDDPDEDNYCEYQIYTQRHLTQWVYRGEEITLIVADTRVDDNKVLALFHNKLERPETKV